MQESVDDDGRWEGILEVGLKEVKAGLLETDSELALGKGDAPEIGKNTLTSKRRRRTTQATHVGVEGGEDDAQCIAESEGEEAYAMALAQKHAQYVVEGECMEVERQDRRAEGAGYRTARAAYHWV